MGKRERLTRHLRVGNVQGLLPLENVIARTTDTLPSLVQRLTERSCTRVIAVLDEAGQLVGLIAADQIVDAVFFHVFPEEYLPDKAGYVAMARHAKDPSLLTAQDIIRPPVWTTTQETVEEAFRKMRGEGLSGLPVYEDDRLIGYVDMLELLAAWFRAGRR